MARSSASSLTRWPTTMLNVLLIRKAETNRVTPAKPSSTLPKMSTMLLTPFWLSDTTCCWLTTLAPDGRMASISLWTLSTDAPESTATSMLWTLPSRS